jgi:DNA invertase Pin-like site-specific DNA recombinase
MKKVIILARVSSKRQEEEGLSLDNQLKTLREYASEKGMEIVKEFVFQESAGHKIRKKFDELIDFITKKKEIDAILAYRVDRITRNYRDAVLLDTLRIEYEKELHFVYNRLVLRSNSVGRDIQDWDLQVFLAKQYLNRLQEDGVNTHRYKLMKGEKSGQAPMGYINVQQAGNKKWIEINAMHGYLMKEAFEKYSTGTFSVSAITKMLAEKGMRNPKTGKVYSNASIHNALRNPFYCGFLKDEKGNLVPHFYEKIIDRSLFEKVQDVLNGWNKKPFKYSAKPFSFRGLLKCSHCGCTITTEEKKGHRYLFCSKFKGECGQKRVRENDLMKEVEKAFKAIQIPKDALEELQKQLGKSIYAKKQYQFDAISTLDKEFKKNQKKLDILLETRINERITEDEFNEKSLQIRRQQEEIIEKKKLHNDADEKFAITVSYLLTLSSRAYDIFKSSKPEEKRELMNFLLWNPTLKHGKLLYTYKKPFDIIARASKCQDWLPHIEAIRAYFQQAPV